ncbi:unnamed protein product, partial [Amoebophrya sp. A25]
ARGQSNGTQQETGGQRYSCPRRRGSDHASTSVECRNRTSGLGPPPLNNITAISDGSRGSSTGSRPGAGAFAASTTRARGGLGPPVYYSLSAQDDLHIQPHVEDDHLHLYSEEPSGEIFEEDEEDLLAQLEALRPPSGNASSTLLSPVASAGSDHLLLDDVEDERSCTRSNSTSSRGREDMITTSTTLQLNNDEREEEHVQRSSSGSPDLDSEHHTVAADVREDSNSFLSSSFSSNVGDEGTRGGVLAPPPPSSSSSLRSGGRAFSGLSSASSSSDWLAARGGTARARSALRPEAAVDFAPLSELTSSPNSRSGLCPLRRRGSTQRTPLPTTTRVVPSNRHDIIPSSSTTASGDEVVLLGRTPVESESRPYALRGPRGPQRLDDETAHHDERLRRRGPFSAEDSTLSSRDTSLLAASRAELNSNNGGDQDETLLTTQRGPSSRSSTFLSAASHSTGIFLGERGEEMSQGAQHAVADQEQHSSNTNSTTSAVGDANASRRSTNHDRAEPPPDDFCYNLPLGAGEPGASFVSQHSSTTTTNPIISCWAYCCSSPSCSSGASALVSHAQARFQSFCEHWQGLARPRGEGLVVTSEPMCTICFEEIEHRDLAAVCLRRPVAHVFHAHCWKRYASTQTQAAEANAPCPVCRDATPQEQRLVYRLMWMHRDAVQELQERTLHQT